VAPAEKLAAVRNGLDEQNLQRRRVPIQHPPEIKKQPAIA